MGNKFLIILSIAVFPDHNMRASMIGTLVIGFLITLTVFFAAVNTESGDIKGFGSLFFLLLHLIFVLVSLPLLVTAIRSGPYTVSFRNIIVVLSLLNFLFMLLYSIQPHGMGVFAIFALFELLPIYLFRRYRTNLIIADS